MVAEMVGVLAREPARLDAWLDAEARNAREFRVGLDLAGLQQSRDATLRALFREVLGDLPAAARTAVAAALERPGDLPAQPLGAA
ncbi:hypothetical protein [Nannocystis exedens]|uniref:hypothetical protein n=1 Tax=Nannocystis exedens TaxID=54 RepID=UPI001160D776|nr:hypothetical protein [Nannocystis exedens]